MQQESIYRDENEFKNELRRLEHGNICAENKESITKYHTHICSLVSEKRAVKLMQELRRLAEMLKKPFKEATKEDIEELMKQFSSSEFPRYTAKKVRYQKLSATTIADYGKILKRFYKWLYGLERDEKAPKIVSWISCKVKRKDIARGEHLLNWEDINLLSSKADCVRDLAFINFLYESGARIAEVLNIKQSDVKFEKNYCLVRVNGKTGERQIPIITSTQHIASYLTTHPKKEANDYLWLSYADKNRHAPLRYAGAVMIINKLFARANLKKRKNPHNFRHSRATELASVMTEPKMRLFFGWDKDSDMPSTYVHLSGRDLQDDFLRLNGIIEETGTKNNTPIKCTLCNNMNTPNAVYCSKCGYGLSVKKVLAAEEIKKQEIDKTMEYFMELAKNPEKLKEFNDFMTSYTQKP